MDELLALKKKQALIAHRQTNKANSIVASANSHSPITVNQSAAAPFISSDKRMNDAAAAQPSFYAPMMRPSSSQAIHQVSTQIKRREKDSAAKLVGNQ